MVGPLELLPQRSRGHPPRGPRADSWRRRPPAAPAVQSTISNLSTYLPARVRAAAAGARRPAAAADRGRHRPDPRRPAPAAVGRGQCRASRRSRCATPPNSRWSNFRTRTSSCWSRTTAAARKARRQAAQQAIEEGAEIILGPLFGVAVPGAAQAARGRNISVIAFSTDSSVAGRGVYLLSFLPESDVDRIVAYAASTGKRSFAAMLPDNAYGNVVEAAFKQAAARRGGRIVAFERYGADRAQMQSAARNIAQALAAGRRAVARRRRRRAGGADRVA